MRDILESDVRVNQQKSDEDRVESWVQSARSEGGDRERNETNSY